MKALEAWQNYLEKKVTYPFDAEGSGYPRKGPLQLGDRVSVKKILNVLNKVWEILNPKYQILSNVKIQNPKRKVCFEF